MEEKRTLIRFKPHSCPVCGKVHSSRILDADLYYRWQNGECIQNVFPDLPKEEREIMISGTCPKCFKELFSRIEDEDIELASNDKPEVVTEQMLYERDDKLKAAVEIEHIREDYKNEQDELKQLDEDKRRLDEIEEKERIDDIDDYSDQICSSGYSLDPFGSSWDN